MKRAFAAAVLATGLFGAGAAHAGGHVNWHVNVGFGLPLPVAVVPAPVVYAPPPQVVYEPPPVYYRPAPVVYASAPVIAVGYGFHRHCYQGLDAYGRPVVFHRHRRHHHHDHD